ncbi:uncharacterized protein G2W53_016377 [Senna tora]|uniref:Uncharacterized protein n=1 Tax=Senna tora TaxID=362788 RepID=A0A834WLG5_9FABA|nr:uncharacterized protein G2W53_016377 [Senna tora]
MESRLGWDQNFGGHHSHILKITVYRKILCDHLRGYGDIQYIVLEKKGHVQLIQSHGNDLSQVIIIQDISFLQIQRSISFVAATQGSDTVKQYALQIIPQWLFSLSNFLAL